MPTQTVDGWAWLHAQTRRFTRTVSNPGAVTDDLIAYAYTEAQNELADLAMNSGIAWFVKDVTVDDTATTFGTQIDYQTHRYFIETDLGITDLARIRRIWRIDPNFTTTRFPLLHLDSLLETVKVRDLGNIVAVLGHEGWTESGDIEPTSGNHEMAIDIVNRYSAKIDGQLLIYYFAMPPQVTPDDFTTVDSAGNLSNKPVFPRQVWHSLLNYAHLVILETIEDDYKSMALWRRLGGTHGVTNRLKSYFARFDDGDAEYLNDTFDAEV